VNHNATAMTLKYCLFKVSKVTNEAFLQLSSSKQNLLYRQFGLLFGKEVALVQEVEV
jgi:hypothetical protein